GGGHAGGADGKVWEAGEESDQLPGKLKPASGLLEFPGTTRRVATKCEDIFEAAPTSLLSVGLDLLGRGADAREMRHGCQRMLILNTRRDVQCFVPRAS